MIKYKNCTLNAFIYLYFTELPCMTNENDECLPDYILTGNCRLIWETVINRIFSINYMMSKITYLLYAVI